ncbi:hypothetical protein BC826DRAFT_993600, partial [Russula brevipes]
MSRTTLRPCLKHSSDLDPPAPTNSPLPFALCSSALGPRVHFPPTPGLCQTHLTHSSAIYDRHPIVVSPNACALPERNERTYVPCGEGASPRENGDRRTMRRASLSIPTPLRRRPLLSPPRRTRQAGCRRSSPTSLRPSRTS